VVVAVADGSPGGPVSRLAADDSEGGRGMMLVDQLAAETGESMTTAVTVAVRERLERVRGAIPREQRADALLAIARRSASRPILDARSADEILGYGDDGLPS